jgi:two-component system, OmpR family, response regulator
MAEDERFTDHVMADAPVFEVVHVRATYPDCGDLDEHVTRTGLRHRTLLEGEVVNGSQNRSLHRGHRQLPSLYKLTATSQLPHSLLDFAAPILKGMADTPGTRLLVVDDEPNIVELLSASLRYAGFDVSTARSGREAVERIRNVRPDLVVLDVLMPGVDGFSVLRQLRGNGVDIPVLFLTAKDAHEDRITGLTLGADDYVTKPFSLAEVIARIQAILRRAGNGNGQRSARLSFADIELDDDSHEVWKAGEAVSLSPTEFKLLRYFLVNAGRAVSKAQILDHVWAYDFGGEANVVESYVSYLRRKIDTTEPKLLHTLRGVGYVLRLQRTPS